jgi:rhomboid protease GluP
MQNEPSEPLVPPKEDLEESVLTRPDRSKADFLSLFLPRQGYAVTPILVYANLLVFLLMALSGVNVFLPSGEDLLNWGANFKPITAAGQGWRLLTCCFVHIGVLHLLMNLYALVYIGALLEPLLGTVRFLAGYVLTGIAASLTSFYWHDATVSAGASGAIFGLYGIFLALLTTDLIEKETRKPLLSSVVVFVGFNLLNGLKGGIDNAAHLGGLVSGLLIGYAYQPSLRDDENRSVPYARLGGLSLVVLALSYAALSQYNGAVTEYEAKMKVFTSQELLALEIYDLPDSTSKQERLDEISSRGFYYWRENLKLLAELDQLALPDLYRERNKKLKRYCELRLKSYHFLYKALDENTTQYDKEIQRLNDEIKNVIQEVEKQSE